MTPRDRKAFAINGSAWAYAVYAVCYFIGLVLINLWVRT